MPADPPPTPAQIRRALAECMTVGDIDDAMGWEPGTARRRRWRSPDRGGLPFADAELGGVALWFRSTIEAWQEQSDGTAPPDLHSAPGDHGDGAEAHAVDPDDEEEDVTDAEPAEPEQEPVDPEEEAENPEEDAQDPEGEAQDQEGEAQDQAEEAESPEEGTAEGDDRPVPVAVRSGYDLELGQQVLADVQGRWREARIRHRDRTTVAVDYNLDGTPMGARRQRVGLDRIRVLDD